MPHKIIHDWGPQFDSRFMRDLYRLLSIEGNPSTAYHPQTDGQTERINQEIEQYLRIFINHHQNDWAEWLPLAEFSYNNKVQTSTNQSPVSNSMLTDERTSSKEKRDNYTGIRPEQFWGKTTIHGVLISIEKPKQCQTSALQCSARCSADA